MSSGRIITCYQNLSAPEQARFDDFLESLAYHSLARNLKVWVRLADRLEVSQYGELGGVGFCTWVISGFLHNGIAFTRRIGAVILRQKSGSEVLVDCIRDSEFAYLFFERVLTVPREWSVAIHSWPDQDRVALRSLLKDLERIGFPRNLTAVLPLSYQPADYIISLHSKQGSIEAQFEYWFFEKFNWTLTLFTRALGKVILQNPDVMLTAIQLIRRSQFECLFFGKSEEQVPPPALSDRPELILGQPADWLQILDDTGVLALIQRDLVLWQNKLFLTTPSIRNASFSSASAFLAQVAAQRKVHWSNFCAEVEKVSWRVADCLRSRLGLKAAAQPTADEEEVVLLVREPEFSPLRTSDAIRSWDDLQNEDDLVKEIPAGRAYLRRAMGGPRDQTDAIRDANLESALTDAQVNKYIKERLPWFLPGDSTLEDVVNNMSGFWANLIRCLVQTAEQKLGREHTSFGSFTSGLEAAIQHVRAYVPATDLIFYDPRKTEEERKAAFPALVQAAFVAPELCELAGQPARATLTPKQMDVYLDELIRRMDERMLVRKRVVREVCERQAVRIKNANPAEPPFDVSLAQLDTLVSDFTKPRTPAEAPQELRFSKAGPADGVWSIKEMFSRLKINNDQFLVGLEEWEECYPANPNTYRDVARAEFMGYLINQLGATPGQAGKVITEFERLNRIDKKQ